MKRLLTASLATLLLLSACGNDPGVLDPSDTGPTPPPSPSTPEGAWQLVEGVPIVADRPITLTIEGARIGGTAACNHYGGVVAFDERAIQIGSLSQTEMACEPEVMESESAFMAIIGRVDGWQVADGFLELAGPGVALQFEPVPPVAAMPITDTLWILETLIRGEAATAPAPGDTPTLRLASDGTFRATTGCRTLSGKWIGFGGDIQPTEMRADGECPPQLADQDGAIISVLEGPIRPEVTEGVLTLTAPGGESLRYRAE